MKESNRAENICSFNIPYTLHHSRYVPFRVFGVQIKWTGSLQAKCQIKANTLHGGYL